MFIKLINHAIFDKTMENARNRRKRTRMEDKVW